MLNQLLSLLGSNSKSTIGISMSPSVGLEMIEINPKTKTIEKYGSRELDYDYSKREIADYDKFIEVLKELFDELKINPKGCSAVLTIPSVHYGLISLPLILGDDGIENAILSDVEQASYIFKRQEPVISWVDAYPNAERENREIAYSAIQQSALENIQAAFIETGCNLAAIETAPNSLLKTLSYRLMAEEQMAPNVIWNLMVINPNSYSMMTLSGKSVMEYREEPLALRSFVGDEIYEAIISSAQMTLQTTPSNYLYIISETDIVSSEVLSMKIPFDGNIKFLESNKYVQDHLMPAAASIDSTVALKVTPEVIGSGIYNISDYPIKFNLLGSSASGSQAVIEDAPKINLGGKEIELTSALMKKIAVIAAIVIIIPTVITMYLLNNFHTKKQNELNEINNRIEANKVELENYANIDRKDTFDVKLETNTVQAYNRTKLIYYSAIGVNIPTDAWLVYLKLYADKKFDIIGRSLTADSVYSFYKGMKMSVINSDLRLNRLEMATDALGNIVDEMNILKPKFYEFEITNLNEDELTALDDELNPSEGGEENTENSPAIKRKRGFLYGDFLEMPEVDSGMLEKIEQLKNSGVEPPKDLPANLESIEKF